jgi:mono/diheme cytochrome c family protein
MKPALKVATFSILVSALLAANPVKAQNADDFDVRKSLIVTELPLLQNFSLKRTMNQLASQAAVPGVTGQTLFRQWFDNLNPQIEAATAGPHCDDQFDAILGVGLFNTYPLTCRPASKFSEGFEAINPVDPLEGYTPITLTNRFDLAPANGDHCGEYRIVYARNSGMTDDRNRNFLIFEAALPNAHPNLGLKGCKEVVKFWTSLSKVSNLKERAQRLETFYYTGHAGFKPVVEIQNYGNNPKSFGQLRTNQFMQPRSEFTSGVWTLREFKLKVTAGTSAIVIPATVKTNPFGALFKSGGTHPRTDEFQNYFLTQVKDLATTDFSFNYVVPDQFNTAQSQANGAENNYVTQLGGDQSVFGQRIQEELTRIGSPLTPTDIVARAQSQSCAGCHRLNSNPGFTDLQRSLGGGLVFAKSLDFTHSTERIKVTAANGEESWQISSVLSDQLLPARKQLILDYLSDKLKNPRKPTDPIGGKSHH